MIISLELDQTWETVEEARDYFRGIVRKIEKVCEETGAPPEWYFRIDTNKDENTIYLTHL